MFYSLPSRKLFSRMPDSEDELVSLYSVNVAESDPLEIARLTPDLQNEPDLQKLSLISLNSPEKQISLIHQKCHISPKKQQYRENRLARIVKSRNLRLNKVNRVVETNLAQNSPDVSEFENVKPIKRCLFPPSPKLPNALILPISVGTQTDLQIVRKIPKEKRKKTPWEIEEDEFLLLGLKRYPKGTSLKLSLNLFFIRESHFNTIIILNL